MVSWTCDPERRAISIGSSNTYTLHLSLRAQVIFESVINLVTILRDIAMSDSIESYVVFNEYRIGDM